MKSIQRIVLLLFFCTHQVLAQDTVLVLKPSMLATDSTQLFISEMSGWLFKQGNDTAWTREDIDLTGWKKLKPVELSEKMVDQDGRLEGWFRIKIKVDSLFGETAFGFRNTTWAATDLYIDGKLVASYGNTGRNGGTYRENAYKENIVPIPLNLKPGKEYLIAFHVVDYLSPFPFYKLKAEDNNLRFIIRLTLPRYARETVEGSMSINNALSIPCAISIILSLLFWLLFFQNRSEKNLLFFSLTSSFLTISLIAAGLTETRGVSISGLSFSVRWILNELGFLFQTLYLLSMPFVLSRIFKRRFPNFLAIIYILAVILLPLINSGFIASELAYSIGQVSFLILVSAPSLYYIVSSWKKLEGAQWAIVIGIVTGALTLFLFVFMVFYFPNLFRSGSLRFLLNYIANLSFPVALLIYVAIRFKEIVRDVQENAKQVVQLSEEKKEQALNQQRVLEAEVTRQTAEIRTTLNDLKATQSQLVQSEKMASLGELTAGIAHEIKNPLNFVNNFSEVSMEMIGEVKEERAKNKEERDEAFVDEILDDIRSNLEKINEHGNRADRIVNSMLQHAREGSGKKEPTDLNALVREFINLSFHGMRAGKRPIDVEIALDLDDRIPEVPLVREDFTRVIINLCNNAFDAMRGKTLEGIEDYHPKLSVRTKSEKNRVLFSVGDNGPGIPNEIKDKILQPFFTTKKGTEGTGLGLSITNDVVKAHGGSLTVETKPNEGAAFIIQLPIL